MNISTLINWHKQQVLTWCHNYSTSPYKSVRIVALKTIRMHTETIQVLEDMNRGKDALARTNERPAETPK